MSLPTRDIVSSVPALAAVGLGLLYGTGALIRSGQLRDEGVSVRDTLPLTPLEDVLALGIGTVTTSLVWVLVFALLFVLYRNTFSSTPEQLSQDVEMRQRLWKSKPRLMTWIRRLTLYGVLPLALMWPFYQYPFFNAISVAAAVFLGAVMEHYRYRGNRYVVYVLLAYFLIIVAANAATAYVWPEPLPKATLYLNRQADPLTGTLIVRADDTWYVSFENGTYRAIPAGRVTTAVVATRHRENEPRPILRVLRDEVEDWLQDDSPPAAPTTSTDTMLPVPEPE